MFKFHKSIYEFFFFGPHLFSYMIHLVSIFFIKLCGFQTLETVRILNGFIFKILVMIQNLFRYTYSCIQGIPYANTFGLEWNIPTPTFGFGLCYGILRWIHMCNGPLVLPSLTPTYLLEKCHIL